MKVVECVNHHKYIVMSFADIGLLICPNCGMRFVNERLATLRDKKKIEKYRHTMGHQKKLPEKKFQYPCSKCRDCLDWSKRYRVCLSNVETCDDLEAERENHTVEYIEYVRGLE